MRIISYLFFVLSFFAAFDAESQTMAFPYKISNITAYLVYNQTGKISENIIDNNDFGLWNTIIGEGSAIGPSNQTMVMVEISGNPKYFTSRDIRLTVFNNGGVFFKQSQNFIILDENSKYYAVFLLYNTGCEELKLSAEILNNLTVESKIERKILFECGE